MTTGFLLGKFMPPHAGHVHLCRTAQGLCDRLVILVCTLPGDPIPGELRLAWMRRLFPGAEVIHHDEVVPQEPADHPDFWPIWRGICRNAAGGPVDLVFGSETYVIRLARELDAEPVLVDPERMAFPVSGTAIRADPAAHWDDIPGPVRPWFQRRVVLFGGESTGKTTLAAGLAARLGTRAVPEYGRVHDLARGGRPWTAADFDAIRQRQQALARSVAEGAGPVLVEDTDPLLTDVWQQMLTGAPAASDSTGPLADLYLLLAPDLPWLDDGTRYFADAAQRLQFHELCIRRLAAAGARHVVIEGLGADREHAALAAIQRAWRDA